MIHTAEMKSQPQTTRVPIIQAKKHKDNTEDLDPLIIPGNCHACGFPNFNIWGVKQNTKLEIKITCMRCGKPYQKIIHHLNT